MKIGPPIKTCLNYLPRACMVLLMMKKVKECFRGFYFIIFFFIEVLNQEIIRSHAYVIFLYFFSQ